MVAELVELLPPRHDGQKVVPSKTARSAGKRGAPIRKEDLGFADRAWIEEDVAAGWVDRVILERQVRVEVAERDPHRLTAPAGVDHLGPKGELAGKPRRCQRSALRLQHGLEDERSRSDAQSVHDVNHNEAVEPVCRDAYSSKTRTKARREMDALGVVVAIVAVLAVGSVAYLLGKRTTSGEEDRPVERRLDEYDFYPFVVDDNGHVEFEPDLFNQAVAYLLQNRNKRAARELIVIGQQNLVRDTFPTEPLQRYKRLYAEYDGDSIVSDNDTFLENYRRLVSDIGRSFPHTGIEVLLHNLVNPSRSLVAIENGAVTGRQVGSGATNLVLDLKTRRQRGEDKVNYELNIGTRQFKCTTVPIFRPEYGLVGAVCINVDAHFIRETVGSDAPAIRAFVDNLLRTDFELDENILSKDEYRLAMRGKRHYLDDAIRSGPAHSQERRLAAILFSDIVGFTAHMGSDESNTLQILAANEEIHLEAIAAHRGRLLKRLGDGMLASFDAASGAVECGREIQEAVAKDGRFQVRVGIHLGEVVESDGDIHGDGVNIASRIQAILEPGQIGFSRVVYDNIRNKEGLSATLLGERILKNVEESIELYTLDG